MRFSSLNRTIHYWISIVVIAPLMLVSLTGILLHVKKHLAWVQPTEHAATPGRPTMGMAELVDIAAAAHPGVGAWDEVARIEIRPRRNLAKVVGADDVEVQVDLGSGAVLQVAQRRSDWLESLHDGSFFGDVVKYGWFLPTAVLLLLSTLTGLVLFLLPYWRKAARRRREARPWIRS